MVNLELRSDPHCGKDVAVLFAPLEVDSHASVCWFALQWLAIEGGRKVAGGGGGGGHSERPERLCTCSDTHTHLDFDTSQMHQLLAATPPTLRLSLEAQSTAMRGGVWASRVIMGRSVVTS